MVNGKVVGHYESTGDTEQDLPIAHAKLAELGYGPKDHPEWMYIRQQAIYFQETCALLMHEELSRPAPRRPFAAIPYVVLTAFCVELYLKTLALKHGKRLHGHKLTELYQALPLEALADITDSIDDALKIVRMREVPDVPAYMSHLNNAFVEWRYAHEKKDLAEVRMDIMHFLRMLMSFACRNEVPRSDSSAAP